ncbi:GNAT family N-acetyltransferase [Microbacterium sp. SORGH_AS_0888]|uniref:GNAT family N-acetyltransferase n=1 Tax=Microbacterium sp. SORGH_AS_0888 TaxID=3041791 RepID=UPI002782D596|nr:GNAT family N-acetyltransferase [Microbacterium sp. SORGH_AS_0888]MDQ1130158.1 putative GNAT family acetyltransferase [Microbacterium sp. SORGH_AS_0888]
MSEPLENVTVTRNDEAGRYEIHVGDVLAGFTVFEPDGAGRLVFPHTSIDNAFAGHGLGSVLVAAALTDVAARGETIVPLCPFVVKHLRSHEVPGLTVEWPEPRATEGFAE